MNRMTNQEIFDKVADHLIKQGRKSIRENTSRYCMYRGADGTMCAVGCLIPDELYSADMEDLTADDLIKKFPNTKKIFNPRSTNLLLDLQDVHDSCRVITNKQFDMEDLIERLLTIRKDHHMRTPPAIKNYLEKNKN